MTLNSLLLVLNPLFSSIFGVFWKNSLIQQWQWGYKSTRANSAKRFQYYKKMYTAPRPSPQRGSPNYILTT